MTGSRAVAPEMDALVHWRPGWPAYPPWTWSPTGSARPVDASTPTG
ncbi:hypothetical protein JNW90_17435 [Micromonospora sp. STR1s_5]|nr:hypothetical protein [Micromonospora sp. STR1s_5]